MRENCLNQLNDNELEFLKFSWPIWARNKQRPPISDWKTWLLLGGRGAGKTRTGAEWVKGIALADPHFPGNSGGRIALVGTTYDDVRDVMIEGESGLLAVHSRADRPTWISSKRELVWRNGVVGKLFSSADPEGLRGNQFGAAWADATTIWGALLAVAASIMGLFGINFDVMAQAEIANTMVQLSGVVGAIIAIYGRLGATEVIS